MEELFVVIPKLPGVRVFQFSDGLQSSQSLADFCQQQGHYLEIAALTEPIYQEIKEIGAKVRLLDENKERYNLRSMQFDTIFVNYPWRELQNFEEFLRKNYRMMKNAADILLFCEQSELDGLTNTLERLNFVAINPIEFRGGVVLSAKKMHGWAKV